MSFTNVDLTVAADSGLAALTNVTDKLMPFAFEARAEPVVKGTQILVEVNTIDGTGDGEYARDTNNYLTETVNGTAGKELNLNGHKKETAFIPAHLHTQDRVNRKIQDLVGIVIQKTFKSIYDEVTLANFPTSQTVAASAIDADKIIDFQVDANTKKWSRMDRGLVLDSVATGTLHKDLDLVALANTGTLLEGEFARLSGFTPVESNVIGDSAPATAENLIGFYSHQGIAVALGVPDAGLDSQSTTEVTQAVHESGIAYQVRRFFNDAESEYSYTVELLWAAAPTDPARLVRIVSA